MIAAGGNIQVRVDFVSEDNIIAVTYDRGNGALFHGILLPSQDGGIVGVNREKYDRWKRAQSDLTSLVHSSPSETSSLALRQTYFQAGLTLANSSFKPESQRNRAANGILSRSVRVVRLRPTKGLCAKCCLPLPSGKNSDFHFPGLRRKKPKPKEERKFLSPVRNPINLSTISLPPQLIKSPTHQPAASVSAGHHKMNEKPVETDAHLTTTTTSAMPNGCGSPAIPKLKISFGTKRKKTLTIVGGGEMAPTANSSATPSSSTANVNSDLVVVEKPAAKRPLSRSSSVDSLEELKPLVIDYDDPEEETLPSATVPLEKPTASTTVLSSQILSTKTKEESSAKKQKSVMKLATIYPPSVPNPVVTNVGEGGPKTETFPSNPHNIRPKDIVWAKMSSCPWWPAEIYALYPTEVSPVQQSVCVIWIDAANEHGFLDIRTQVEPFLLFFKKRYNRKRNSPGYQVSIGQALKQTKEQMGSTAFSRYEKDIVGLVSNECLRAMGYSPDLTTKLISKPTQEKSRKKLKKIKGEKKSVEIKVEPTIQQLTAAPSDSGIGAELDSIDTEQPSCSSAAINAVELGPDMSSAGQSDGESNLPSISTPILNAEVHHNLNVGVKPTPHQPTPGGDDISLFDSVLTELQQINELCDNTSAKAQQSTVCKLSCT